jgi:hypothetical protein
VAHELNRGRWVDPDYPQDKWDLLESVDVGKAEPQCDMCQCARIRYVHVVWHPLCPTEGNFLCVGCICAVHMTGSEEPRECERLLQNRASREAGWLNRKWESTTKPDGTVYVGLRKEGLVLTQDSFGNWTFRTRSRGLWTDHGRSYPELQHAKMAAFYVVDPEIDMTREAREARKAACIAPYGSIKKAANAQVRQFLERQTAPV